MGDGLKLMHVVKSLTSFFPRAMILSLRVPLLIQMAQCKYILF